ncbi:hypothetical protein [Streptomyces sp. NPDC051211]|uniref:hypothetical protein n=1 Tax=Streptomyces sp. NPDC051211 TaxID=3154643 RepID=UPI0034504CEC
MRLRTTAVAFAGAFALVLPVSGQALADGGGLNYTYFDDGRERRGHLRPAGDSTCYLLNGTSRQQPAVEAFNETDRAALLFDNEGCAGDPVAVAEPHEGADDFEAIAVRFERPRDKERPPRDDEDVQDEGRDHRDEDADQTGDDVDHHHEDGEEADNSRGDEEDADREDTDSEDVDIEYPAHEDSEDSEGGEGGEGGKGGEDGEGGKGGEDGEDGDSVDEERSGGRGPAHHDLFSVIFRAMP